MHIGAIRGPRDAVIRMAIGFDESHRAIVEALDRDATLVHQAMVEAAGPEQIARGGLAAAGPVVDVMVNVLGWASRLGSSASLARRKCRAVRSTWSAVPCRTIKSKRSSVAGSATRVSSRTFQ